MVQVSDTTMLNRISKVRPQKIKKHNLHFNLLHNQFPLQGAEGVSYIISLCSNGFFTASLFSAKAFAAFIKCTNMGCGFSTVLFSSG